MISILGAVTITPSEELALMQLIELVGRTGTVTDIKRNSSLQIYGAWVLLDGEPHLEESEWFIPIESLKEL